MQREDKASAASFVTDRPVAVLMIIVAIAVGDARPVFGRSVSVYM